MKKYFFVSCFLWFAQSGWSQVSFLDTIYFSNTDKYLWTFYQNLQTFVSLNESLFKVEDQNNLKYLNVLDTITEANGILEINLKIDNPDIVSLVFISSNGKAFFLHFNRNTKTTFIVKEKILIDIVLTNETNENGDYIMELRETAMLWGKQDPTKYQIIERVIKKFF